MKSLTPELHEALIELIVKAVGMPLDRLTWKPLGGGCISATGVVSGAGEHFFVKVNDLTFANVFESEARALRVLGESKTVRVPSVLGTGVTPTAAFLVLEYLELKASPTQKDWETLGAALAELHRYKSPRESEAQNYGWCEDNVIGSTPQRNDWMDDWAVFWRDCRIAEQLKLAKRNGIDFPWAEAMLLSIPKILADHQPPASLLHGDLWRGNAAISVDGQPMVYDPASYWGDRESDLAMTELFGGFPSVFYNAYRDAYPLESGYLTRKKLYNLYHVLNHCNLFGCGYVSQANQIARELQVSQ